MIDEGFTIVEAALRVFPRVILFDGGRYAIATLLMSAILYIAHRTSLRARIIQTRKPTRADYRRELLASARTVLVYATLATPALWLSRNGYTASLYEGEASGWVIAGFIVALLIAHDTWFYWTHRAMHSRALFKHFHRLHHRSITPTPFTAYAFDWTEAAIQALFVLIWISFIPTPWVAVFSFLIIMILRNVWGHCGTELHPPGFADHWFWGNFTTTTHHDLHHNGNFNHNCGLYFTWWDRLMGTEHPRYREIFREVTARRPAAASVNEPRDHLAVAAADLHLRA